MMKFHTEAGHETIQLAAQQLPLTNRVQILTHILQVPAGGTEKIIAVVVSQNKPH
jgi:hypothetical protein